jgi:anti-anti-sigma factor
MHAFDTGYDLPVLRVRVGVRATGTVVVTVTGEIDHDSAPRIRQTAADLLSRGRLRHILVDLAGVTFFRAAGVQVLLECRDAAERQQARLEISRPPPLVRQVLEFTGVGDLFLPPAPRPSAAVDCPGRGASEDEPRRPHTVFPC